MGVDGEVAGGIDRDDFDVMLLAALVVSAENVAADAAETGDGNTNWSCLILLVFVVT